MRWGIAVSLLGIAQIASWGSLYYTLGVISHDMARDTGTSDLLLFGAFSGALLLAGLLAPKVGLRIDLRSARQVLTGGSMLAGIALALLAMAQGPLSLAAAWAVAGIAISATLYDAGFAAVSQVTQAHYRRAVTLLTLFGGFASTVFWPLTHALQQTVGWRDTLWVYAALHICLCAPIHWFVLPERNREQGDASTVPSSGMTKGDGRYAPSMFWLSVSFALGSAVVAVVGVHMVGLLTGKGLSREDAVLCAMLMGPAQVLGRVLEITLFSALRASRVGLLAMGTMAFSLSLLAIAPAWLIVGGFFAIAYGLGNGILTIVRGSAPAELFGQENLGETLGRLSRPAMFAKALAPGLFAALLATGVSLTVSLITVATLALLALLALLKASTDIRAAIAATT